MEENKASVYEPPFTVNNEILSLVADIAETVGHISATSKHLPTPQLRRQNRIRTIHSSLAIEKTRYPSSKSRQSLKANVCWERQMKLPK